MAGGRTRKESINFNRGSIASGSSFLMKYQSTDMVILLSS